MVVGIIQARLGSSRLPGKVLKKVCNKSMFEHLVERVQHSTTLDKVVLATTTNSLDDKLAQLSEDIGIPCYRGSENDVVDRYYNAAHYFKADVVVRLLNDCPLLDPLIIDEIVGYYLDNSDRIDFISNQHPHTYPDGMDVSVFSIQALDKLHAKTNTALHREHVVPGFWELEGEFRWQNYHHKINLFKDYRLTLDYEEDFQVISNILTAIYNKDKLFTMDDILKHLNGNDNISNLNRKYI